MVDYNTHDDVSATVQAAPKTIRIDRNDWDNTPAAYPDDDFGFYIEEDFEKVYQRLIEDDLRSARENYNLRKLENLTDENLRGIWFDTWRHWHCGYLENWILTKSRAEWKCGTYVDKETGERKHLPPPSRRIIVPTPSMNHFNAIALATDRKTMDKKFWKQHAGEKELFYDKTLHKAKIALGFEGEVDAMSVWQACCFKISEPEFSPVAILGCSNWKKTLLPNLGTLLRGKKILLVLDGDESGRKSAAELRKGLIQRRTPTVTKFLYDALSEADQKLFGIKVDANDLLIKRGEEFLRDLINKIVAEAQVEFDAAQQEIDSQNLFANRDDRQSQPSQPKKPVTEADKPTVTDLLKFVKARKLSREEWLSVGIIMKYAGFTLDDFKKWSDDGDYRYSAETCSREWNTVKPAAQLGDDKGYTLGTLVKLAKQGGYAPPHEKKTPTADDFKTGDATVDEWQRQFGVIDKQVYLEICAAKNFLTELTTETLTAAVARSKSTLYKVAMCSYYDFALAAADKFFATLDDAKSRVAAQVADAKKTDTNVAADVRMMAALSVSEIRKSLAPLVTKIRKAHKTHVDDFKAKCEAATVKTLQEKLKRNAPTTRQKIEDCPVDLVVPPTVYFGETECGIQNVLPNGTLVARPGALAPVTISKKFCDGDGNTEYEVAIKTGGKWHKHCVDGRTLQSARGVEVLGGYGLPIEDTGALSKYFARLVAANDATFTVTKVYSRPGWHGDKFIYPVSDDGSYLVRRNGINYKEIFTPHGDRDAWLFQFIKNHGGSNHGALQRTILGACALPPLLEVFKIPNPQFNIWGTSNFAKTPIVKLGLSIFGNPTAGCMLRTWNSTAKNMLTMAAGFNGMVLYLDEGETMSRRTQDELSKFVYDFSIGVIGEANKRNGDVRQAENFHSVRISTAERPLHDDADKRGSFKRLIDLHVTDAILNDDTARNLHITCENNYGHFGRQWTRYIEANAADIAKEFEETYEYFAGAGFDRDGTRVALSTVDATNARAVIACAVASWRFFKCIDPDTGYSSWNLRDDVAAILATLPTVDEIDDVNRSIRLLASWVVENPKRFRNPKRDDHGQTIPNEYYEVDHYAGAAGIKLPNGSIAFFANAFRDVVAEIGLPNYRKFLCDLHSAGYLDCKNSRSKAKVIWVDGFSTRAYVVNADAFSSDTDD